MMPHKLNYPSFNAQVSFSSYISQCQAFIKERRYSSHTQDLHSVVEANAPFNLYPDAPLLSTNHRLKYGALLIHGLLDCPFTLRDIANKLKSNGIMSRAVLLPGHGTSPHDLLSVTCHDWIQIVRYGIETLQKEVEHIFLIGYSTGAALSIHHALKDTSIVGLILMAPAIKIKVAADMITGWHYLRKKFSKQTDWICFEDEIDYTKYRSIAFQPVQQVHELITLNHQLLKQHSLACPIHMIVTEEDETISSQAAIQFFLKEQHPDSVLILYSSKNKTSTDTRVISRISRYPDLNINNLSHISLPFSPDNSHYGRKGDYPYASRITLNEINYGAYNRMEENFHQVLFSLGIIKRKKCILTYNPDFDFMATSITNFILRDQK